MSQANVELVRAGFTAFERGDMTAMLNLMSDQLVVYRADPDAATFHGKEVSVSGSDLSVSAHCVESVLVVNEVLDASDSATRWRPRTDASGRAHP
jgi:ketosteroid isomerase-like protein